MIKTIENQLVLGVFAESQNAETAIMKLEEIGYNPKNMSIIMRDKAEAERIGESTGSNIASGAISGAATGGVLGAVAGLLVGIGVIVVPGIGGLLIGGPIAAALGLTGAAATTLTGGLTGALAGGLIGALTGLGVTYDDAKYYQDRIKTGGVLLIVPVTNDTASEASQILERYDAEQVRVIRDLDSMYQPDSTYIEKDPGYTAYASDVNPRRSK